MRLGDLIDDYCPRCRLLLNHAAASFVDGEVVKVVCQTCHSEHPYLHEENPVKKKPHKSAGNAFDQVLAKVAPAAEPAPDPPEQKKAKKTEARYISRHQGARPPRKRN